MPNNYVSGYINRKAFMRNDFHAIFKLVERILCRLFSLGFELIQVLVLVRLNANLTPAN